MSVKAGEPWEHAGVKFHGLSLSGIRTAVSMPELSLSFDTAQGFPYLLTLKNFFVTHGHLDHAAGIPYIISQKAMTSQEAPKFYMPPSLVQPMDAIMKLWQQIEKHEYRYEFIPMLAGDKITLSPKYFVQAFPSVHRIESNGYTVFETRKKLADKYKGLPREELQKMSMAGQDLNEVTATPIISFTGDTQIEFLDGPDHVRKSKILMMECTYLDERKSIQAARDWGHLHLDELIPRLKDIEAEKIVLIHLSSRYSWSEALSILERKLPPEERERVVLFPGR